MHERFVRDDVGYAKWRKANPKGYVFNHFGGRDSKMNVLHKVHCPTLDRPEDQGRRTVVPKICSVEYASLVEELNRLVGEQGWAQCGVCGG